MFEKNKLKKNTFFLDYLRVLSCIAIVIIHINHNSIVDSTTLPESTRVIISYINSLLYWAVPMFFMISGYIFLGVKSKCTYKSMAKYYIKMIILILFTFTAFNIAELYIVNKSFYIDIFKDALYLTLKGKSWDHMWFLMTIFVAYLIFPLVRPFYDKADRDLDIFIFLFGIFTLVIPEINKILNIDIFSNFIFDYRIYFCFLGGYLSKKKVANNVLNNVTLVALLFITLLISGFFYWNKNLNINLTSFTNRLLTAVIAFLLFNIFANMINKKNDFFRFLSKYTLYIYIFHVAFIHILTKALKIFPYELKYPVIMVILSILIIFISSLLVGVIIKPIEEYVDKKIYGLFNIKE